MRALAPACLALLFVRSAAAGAPPALPPAQAYADGHARPRALLYQPRDRLLYAALSTSDEVVAIDPFARPARLVARVRTGLFPQALAGLPAGGVLVSCRFDPDLGIVEIAPGGPRYRRVPAGPEHGHRGLALSADGRLAYVASPPARGVKVVSLTGGGVLQVAPAGLSPRALLLVDDPRAAGRLLLVANFLGRTLTAHPLLPDGRVAPPVQTVATEAPVQELLLVSRPRPRLLLLTHEDRPVDRDGGPVTGLDSVVLSLPLQAGPQPLADPGPGRRVSYNLTERGAGLLAKLDAAVYDGTRDLLALAGAATDNVLLTDLGREELPAGVAVTVGTSPVALALLPDGRVATADRLSDTVSLVTPATQAVEQVVVGRPERQTPAELGELLFYGRALVPRNVADGPLSVYACSACHDDGHVDGRRHPARRNRFRSMTKTCRGLATTAPYLSLGEIRTLQEFADNIVATHAQGEERDPEGFDRYPVALRVRGAHGWAERTLSPDELRRAMAAYMAVIPLEPSPFVPPGSTALGPEARAGLRLFRARCVRCHQLVGDTALGDRVPPRELERRLLHGEVALAAPGRFAVGTPVLGQGGNNPPSLRGVWDAAPYLSDGSAATLEELLRRTDPRGAKVHGAARPGLSERERAALLAFLRAL